MSDERMGELRTQLEAQDEALAEATARIGRGQSAAVASSDLEQVDLLSRGIAPKAAVVDVVGIRG